MKVPSARQREPLELKMTPMIDVVFLLLVFFLWTSSFEKSEYLLPSAIAEPPSGAGTETPSDAPVEVFDELIIQIAMAEGTPSFSFNQQNVNDLAELRGRMRQIIQLGVLPPVIVNPSRDVPVGLAIEVYDVAREVGFDRVLFAAR
ncbi:MAG: biopolymer transporter ExbD [Pirellulaceae bacterium]